MKILYLLKQDPDETAKRILDEHKKSHEVLLVDVRKNQNYDQIIDLIASSDKVISW